MNSQINMSELPSLLKAIQTELSSNAVMLLVRAFEKKEISTLEIGNLLKPEARKGQKFSSAVKVFAEIFRHYGVKVNYSVVSKSNPPPKPEKVWPENILPITSDSTDDAKYSDEEMPSEEVSNDSFSTDGTFGWYLSKVSKHTVLSKSDTDVLAMKAKGGDVSARNKVIEHNHKLIIWVARKYRNRGLDDMELIQEGVVGFIRAFEKFEIEKGHFSTYVVWWIKQYIRRAIQDKVKLVRLPVYVDESLSKLRKVNEELIHELGRDPTDKEVKAQVEAVSNVSELLRMMKWTVTSLDQPVTDDSESKTTYLDFISDENSLNPSSRLQAKEELEQSKLDIQKLISLINDLPYSNRNKEMFLTYYGLSEGDKSYTLEDIGNMHGLTRERVRQINEKIWKELDRQGTPLDEKELNQTLEHIAELEILAHS